MSAFGAKTKDDDGTTPIELSPSWGGLASGLSGTFGPSPPRPVVPALAHTPAVTGAATRGSFRPGETVTLTPEHSASVPGLAVSPLNDDAGPALRPPIVPATAPGAGPASDPAVPT